MTRMMHAFMLAIGGAIAIAACAQSPTGPGVANVMDVDGSTVVENAEDAAGARADAKAAKDGSTTPTPSTDGATSNANDATAPTSSCSARTYTFEAVAQAAGSGMNVTWSGFDEPKLGPEAASIVFYGFEGITSMIASRVPVQPGAPIKGTLVVTASGATFTFVSPAVAPSAVSALEAEVSAFLAQAGGVIAELSTPLTSAIETKLVAAGLTVPASIPGMTIVPVSGTVGSILLACCVPEVIQLESEGGGLAPL